ncbi:MAG: cytochrome c oxidase subunit II [Gemmatimonadaceae bacterium]
MPADSRPRWRCNAALTVALTSLIAGCTQNPNSVFHSRTEFNRDVDSLFTLLIWLGTIVFVFTEALLIYALWRYRHKPDSPRTPKQVHGSTRLEILWTVIPAVVLAIIAVPTVQTMFKTQGAAPADAIQVEVIGHQWWWEFRYLDYDFTTANEIYMPIGRPMNFHLKTVDVIHSFWVPALGGKRDMVNNRTNYLWFTPDSTTEDAFNGFCAEYCGTSHANMRFRAFAVTPEQFDAWVANQQRPGAVLVQLPGAPAAAPQPAAPRPPAAAPAAPAAPAQAGFMSFARLPDHAMPHTPIPHTLRVDTTLIGDVARGAQLVAYGTCIGCHTVKGSPTLIGRTAPDLTHIGSRLTIGGGLFPNDKKHLMAWIKNSRTMKPGVLMPTLGIGEYDPILKQAVGIGLSDQQIADVVAYLHALK